MPFCSPLVTFADKKDGSFSVKQKKTLKESWGLGGGRLRLMELLKKIVLFIVRKIKKDYLNICHIKKKKFI